ncbi:MAG: 5-(carboxyamino)imidazole ribonucleotide mutase [Bacteroidia bacterium]|nr:5-(carboxyamino)imidazole ribonucleotide mutase [Bacteroidia bacterium]
MSQVSILMGSDSDLPIMKSAAQVLDDFNVEYEIRILSVHRTHDLLVEYIRGIESSGIRVVIAGAGGAAHLPGTIASITALPVIGVPILSTNSIMGLDSVLSILQMPSGVPVATVSLNGAKNAGLLAIQMLATGNESLLTQLKVHKHRLAEEIKKKSDLLIQLGIEAYLASK